MLTPHKLLVDAWAKFQHAELQLDSPGLHFVRGRNYDANGTANGAGKSSLFHALYALQYGDHQLAVRKRSLGQHTRSGTRIAASYHCDAKRVIADMHDTKLQVKVDGKLLAARKKDDERAGLLQLLNHPTERWNAFVHVNGIASNPLLRGTSSARCAFLENAFDLDRWAPLYDIVGDAISAMRRADADLGEARDELGQLGDPVDTDALRKQSSELTIKRDKLRVLSDEATRAAAIRETLPERPKQNLDELLELAHELKQAAVNSTQLHAEQARYNHELTAYNENRNELARQVRSATEGMQASRAGDIARYQAAIEKTEKDLELGQYYERFGPAIEAWKRVAGDMAKTHSIRWKTIDELRSLSNSWVANLQGGQQNCPVCGSRLRNEVDRTVIDRLSKLVEKLPSIIREVNNSTPSVAESEAKLSRLRAALQSAEDHEHFSQQMSDTKLALERLVTPKSPRGVSLARDGSASPENVRGASDPARDYARTIQLVDSAKRWAKAPEHAKRDLAGLQQRRDKISAMLESVEVKLGKINVALVQAKIADERRADLTDKIDKLEREVELRPIYKALQQAYSPNGLRLWKLQGLIDSIISGLNIGAHSTRDRVSFGYKLSRNRELALTASNDTGTFDIRTLSGAESGFFVLNFLATVLPMLPASKRCSMLILDELDGTCDEQSRSIMAAEYLPRLAKIVPTIFVVTPAGPNTFKTPGSTELLIAKKGGVSSIHA